MKKIDGSVQFGVDYRRLHKVAERDVYPLVQIDELNERICGATYFTTLNLQAGYWQVEVEAGDMDKTVPATRCGLCRFVRMSFGLSKNPAPFSE